ncbi:MAG: hypothetical protein PHU71_07350 [Candidatus Gracilibacteria bacterium]|nr:hypothetical protein [Candidatus Gracilibacteria bacterium]
MDFNLIKKLLKKEGGKIIIVEDGNPTMIISSFEDSEIKKEEKPVVSQGIAMPAPKQEPILPPVEEKVMFSEKPESGLTIDDLPF